MLSNIIDIGNLEEIIDNYDFDMLFLESDKILKELDLYNIFNDLNKITGKYIKG